MTTKSAQDRQSLRARLARKPLIGFDTRAWDRPADPKDEPTKLLTAKIGGGKGEVG